MDARPSELALDEEALLIRLSPRCFKYSLSSKICKPHTFDHPKTIFFLFRKFDKQNIKHRESLEKNYLSQLKKKCVRHTQNLFLDIKVQTGINKKKQIIGVMKKCAKCPHLPHFFFL